jgi:hypothetical protein
MVYRVSFSGRRVISQANSLDSSTVARDGDEIFLVSVMENEAKGGQGRACLQAQLTVDYSRSRPERP